MKRDELFFMLLIFGDVEEDIRARLEFVLMLAFVVDLGNSLRERLALVVVVVALDVV
jgi:hypothetical protein